MADEDATDSGQQVEEAEGTEETDGAEVSIEPAEVAADAAAIHTEHCGDVSLRDVRKAAGAVAAAAPMWGRLDQTYRDHGHSYLLYWRGLFAECIGQPDRAVEDLVRYVDETQDDAGSRAMVAQARARIRRLGRGTTRTQTPTRTQARTRAKPRTQAKPRTRKTPNRPGPPGKGAAIAAGIIAGVGMSGASAGFGVASANAWSNALHLAETDLYANPHSPAQVSATVAIGDQLAAESQATGSLAVLIGAGAVAAFITTAIASRQGKRAQVAWGIAPSHPRNPGLTLQLVGHW